MHGEETALDWRVIEGHWQGHSQGHSERQWTEVLPSVLDDVTDGYRFLALDRKNEASRCSAR